MADITDGPNADQAADWDGSEGEHWVANEARYDAMLRPFGRVVLAAAALRGGEHVLDVGCGCGDASLAAGRAVGASGSVLGVDLSEAMLARAEQRAREERLRHVRFEHGDAQVHPFPDGCFDAVVSRFGVMFFADPVAAFANLARALRPGGRLAFVCWQGLAANDWMLVPGLAIAQHMPLRDLGPEGGPGPFSFSDPDRVSSIVGEAGFGDVAIEPHRGSLVMAGGGDVDDAVTFMRGTFLGRSLFEGADPAAVDAAVRAVRRALVPYATPDGVRLGAAVWVVTGHRPV